MHKLKIFCDFDGTITNKDVWMDVGEYFIKDKVKWNSIIKQFENLEIGARECFLNEIELIENFDLNKFNDIIDNIKLDNKFINFCDFCNKNNFPLIVLSEGMDYYIERIFINNHINFGYTSRGKSSLREQYFANHFIYDEKNNSISLKFPYSDSDCTKCGCCKRNLLLNMTGDDELSVYIGDWFSDACVSNYADMVFAKKSLASYCWKNNITYFDYNNFGDVQTKLEKMIQKRLMKPKQNAKVKRKDVFLRG